MLFAAVGTFATTAACRQKVPDIVCVVKTGGKIVLIDFFAV